jgi:hypothetical protein
MANVARAQHVRRSRFSNFRSTIFNSLRAISTEEQAGNACRTMVPLLWSLLTASVAEFMKKCTASIGMAGRVAIASSVPAAERPALVQDTGLKSTDQPVPGAEAA